MEKYTRNTSYHHIQTVDRQYMAVTKFIENKQIESVTLHHEIINRAVN